MEWAASCGATSHTSCSSFGSRGPRSWSATKNSHSPGASGGLEKNGNFEHTARQGEMQISFLLCVFAVGQRVVYVVRVGDGLTHRSGRASTSSLGPRRGASLPTFRLDTSFVSEMLLRVSCESLPTQLNFFAAARLAWNFFSVLRLPAVPKR